MQNVRMPFNQVGNKATSSLISSDFIRRNTLPLLRPTVLGDCLLQIGKYNAAVACYEKAIEQAQQRGETRQVALAKAELGSAYLQLEDYNKAIEFYTQALAFFKKLGESTTFANGLYQLGMAYRMIGEFEQAERCYQQSLKLHVQQKNSSVFEADVLKELGALYQTKSRLENAGKYFQRAAEIYFKVHDLWREYGTRLYAASVFFQLQRYDEARRELNRALECMQTYGHTAEPWKTWDLLYDLEQAIGHPEAAAQARQQAIQCFLAYRRDGGENHATAAKLCAMVAQAIGQSQPAQAAATLSQYANHPDAKVLITKLQAILNGNRNPALADDPALPYDEIVELQLLLEGLGKVKG